MVSLVLRGAVLLWAFFFFIVGARGLLDPASYTETFGFTISGVAINSAILYTVTTLIGAPAGMSPALWENVGKLVAVPVAVIWNFFGYKFFVFRRQPDYFPSPE